jgi:hypothetical protein
MQASSASLRALARRAAAAPLIRRSNCPRFATGARAEAPAASRPVKLLGICGSLRCVHALRHAPVSRAEAPPLSSGASVNAGLLRAAAASLPPGVTLEVLVPQLPMYDGDLEAQGVPPAVTAFRAKVRKPYALAPLTCADAACRWRPRTACCSPAPSTTAA